MDILLYIGIFVASLTALLFASDWFTDAAEEIGTAFGIPSFVIGLTIVALGTSLPELATSIISVLEGNSEIVVGNVVGSNITNIALVLGLVLIYAKFIRLEYNIWHIDMSFLWASAFFLWLVVYDRHITALETILLLSLLVIFLMYLLKKGPNEDGEEEEKKKRDKIRPIAIGKLIVGATVVWLGAEYTIDSIIQMSKILGFAPEYIALSAIALGTSLPEVFVSISAIRKGNAGIAIGNILGSNIFNTFAVMGISSIFGPLKIPDNIFFFYIPLMIIISVIFGIISNNKKLTQWEGYLLLVFYLFYMGEILQNL